MVYNLIDI